MENINLNVREDGDEEKPERQYDALVEVSIDPDALDVTPNLQEVCSTGFDTGSPIKAKSFHGDGSQLIGIMPLDLRILPDLPHFHVVPVDE